MKRLESKRSAAAVGFVPPAVLVPLLKRLVDFGELDTLDSNAVRYSASENDIGYLIAHTLSRRTIGAP